MAKTRGPKSRATGRWVLCPASGFLHPGFFYVQVHRRESAFYRCTCQTNVFLGASWRDDMGLTYEQAKAIPGATVS